MSRCLVIPVVVKEIKMCRYSAFLLLALCVAFEATQAEEQLQIISLKRVDEPPRYSDDKNCATWRMAESQVKQAFRRMDRVDAGTWHVACSVYSCTYQGKVKYMSKTYDMEANAGSAIILFNEGEETLYFIDRKKRPYFLEACTGEEKKE